MPAIRSSHADHTNNALVLIVLLQYVPRLYMIFPLSSQIVKATGVVTKTAWAGAAYNLLLYMLASHVRRFFFDHHKFPFVIFSIFHNIIITKQLLYVLVGVGGIMVFAVN